MMHFGSLALATLMAVHATALVAWSGTACNGDQGDNVVCNGTCFAFAGRQSFIAATNGDIVPHCVSVFTGTNCDGTRFDFAGQQLQCSAALGCATLRSASCVAGAACP